MYEKLSPRHAVAVGLIALIPALIYGLGRPGLAGFIAAVNVILIFASLYLAMSPIDGANHANNGSST
ncbi:cytochrome-ba3 oxidase subunit [Natrialbaceae archaeon A-CW3]